MSKKMILDSGAHDSMHPQSQTYEPQGHVAPGADRQGRNDITFWNSVEKSKSQFDGRDALTCWTLQNLEQPRQVEPATDVKSPGFDNFAQAKEKAAADIIDRFRKGEAGLKDGGKSGSGYDQQSGLGYDRKGPAS
jgi:hypothetical protein